MSEVAAAVYVTLVCCECECPLYVALVCSDVLSSVCVVCRLETANLKLEGELERAPGWEEVHRCTHTRARTRTGKCMLYCTCDLLLLPCQPHSRDAAIKALELDLAAAPKQERMDQLVWAQWRG